MKNKMSGPNNQKTGNPNKKAIINVIYNRLLAKWFSKKIIEKNKSYGRKRESKIKNKTINKTIATDDENNLTVISFS